MTISPSDLIGLGLPRDAIRIERDPAQLRDVWPTGLKGGQPDGGAASIVVTPGSAEVVARILGWAGRHGVSVQVQGGRSNVVGALDGLADLVLRTSSLDAIGEPDPVSQTVTVGAGVLGGRLEAFLDSRGFTLGHFPQSIETSTVGGWIATRATGTASAGHGGIERLVCGVEAVLPSGEMLSIPARPRAGGGLDAIALLCGTEGSLAVVTEVTLSISRRLPERRLVSVFPGFDEALAAQRTLVQARLPVFVLRVLNATESTALAPPGSCAPGESLLIANFESDETILASAELAAHDVIRSSGGRIVDLAVADGWWRSRYAKPGLIEDRNVAPGAMFDTIEVSAMWSAAAPIARSLEGEIGPLVQDLWLHSSHAYTSGTCLYLAFWIEAADDAAALARCAEVWERSLRIVEAHGGNTSHHHGIGAARSGRYVESPEGVLHRLIKGALDPTSVLAARLLEGGAPASRGNP